MDAANAGKRVWAVHLKRSAVGFGIVFLGAILWETLFLEPYERNGAMAGVIAVLVYVAVSFALAAINGASGLAYLWLFGGNDMKDLVLADLRSARLPGPRPDQPKRFEYLAELVEDEELEAKVRIRAAAVHTAYQVAMHRSGLLGGLALAKALDEAALRYSMEAPKQT
jgi:hypothetical protein